MVVDKLEGKGDIERVYATLLQYGTCGCMVGGNTESDGHMIWELSRSRV